MIICKSCKSSSKLSYSGLCGQCYNYYIKNKYINYTKPEYGTICKVEDKNSEQYGMIICHECGKAYTKLQQHIYYKHNMTKSEYCDKWGLDRGVRLTSDSYHDKMSELAYKYGMDERLKSLGIDTRFKIGHKSNYKRSYQTQQRLKHNSFKIGKNNIKNK